MTDTGIVRPATGEPSTEPILFDTIPYQMISGRGEMTCERISDTVAIIASLTKERRFSGHFTVATASGYAIGLVHACITCTRKSATRVAAIDVDWSDAGVVATFDEDKHDQLRHAMAPMLSCDCTGNCYDGHCTSPDHY